jgi:hypothetical protein
MQTPSIKHPESNHLFARRAAEDQILVAGAGTFATVEDGKLFTTPIAAPDQFAKWRPVQ